MKEEDIKYEIIISYDDELEEEESLFIVRDEGESDKHLIIYKWEYEKTFRWDIMPMRDELPCLFELRQLINGETTDWTYTI